MVDKFWGSNPTRFNEGGLKRFFLIFKCGLYIFLSNFIGFDGFFPNDFQWKMQQNLLQFWNKGVKRNTEPAILLCQAFYGVNQITLSWPLLCPSNYCVYTYPNVHYFLMAKTSVIIWKTYNPNQRDRGAVKSMKYWLTLLMRVYSLQCTFIVIIIYYIYATLVDLYE